MSQLIVQIYKLSRTALKIKSKSCESQLRSPSHRFTGKSEQTLSLKSTPKDGMTSPCRPWRNALWLNAMKSGKK